MHQDDLYEKEYQNSIKMIKIKFKMKLSNLRIAIIG
ncbi:unnamed protein product [Paramecium pentaurelia]|uniref:Uncharacterized protein n=1 Tax=Paramecium pentaurelia TaxID=43138 RepID=A0A8S1VZ26_9CILI|nr:unnamed protein product [Paramecium pentaurelia]